MLHSACDLYNNVVQYIYWYIQLYMYVLDNLIAFFVYKTACSEKSILYSVHINLTVILVLDWLISLIFSSGLCCFLHTKILSRSLLYIFYQRLFSHLRREKQHVVFIGKYRNRNRNPVLGRTCPMTGDKEVHLVTFLLGSSNILSPTHRGAFSIHLSPLSPCFRSLPRGLLSTFTILFPPWKADEIFVWRRKR